MVLNYDCLRDVLLALEIHLQINEEHDPYSNTMDLSFGMICLDELMECDEVKGYDKADVFYAIHNLRQAGYINASLEYYSGVLSECAITDITYAGHMFLRSIHDETIWTAIKKRFGPAINVAIPVISEVAAQLALKSLV